MNNRLVQIGLGCAVMSSLVSLGSTAYAQVDPRVRYHVDSMLNSLLYQVSNYEPMCSIDEISCNTQRQIICQGATVFSAKVDEYIYAGQITDDDTSVETIKEIRQDFCGGS